MGSCDLHEGAIGPVAGNGHHSMATRMPGLNVIAPSTSSEYESYFKEFLDTDKVFLVSEHRRLFRNEVDLSPIIENQSKIAILAVSSTRIDAVNACITLRTKYNIPCDYFGIVSLSPLEFDSEFTSKHTYESVIILDIDFQFSSISSQIELNVLKMNPAISTVNMALPSAIAGFSSASDLRTPSPDQIVTTVRELSSSD